MSEIIQLLRQAAKDATACCPEETEKTLYWLAADEMESLRQQRAGRVPEGLLAALRNQRQLDTDGIEVGVSRQAVDEAIEIVERITAAPQPPAGGVGLDEREAFEKWQHSGGLKRPDDPGERKAFAAGAEWQARALLSGQSQLKNEGKV